MDFFVFLFVLSKGVTSAIFMVIFIVLYGFSCSDYWIYLDFLLLKMVLILTFFFSLSFQICKVYTVCFYWWALSLSLSLSLSHTCAHTATQTDTGICIVNLLTHSHTHDYPLLLIIGLFFWYLFFFFLYTVHLLIGSLIWQCPLRTMPILLLSELVSIWSQRRQIVVQWQVVLLLDVAWAEQVHEAPVHQVLMLLWDPYLHLKRMLRGLCSTVRLAGS